MRIFIYVICIMIGFTLLINVLFASGDEKTNSAPQYTIGVVLKAMDSEHWLAVRSSMQKAAQANNINLIILWPNNESAYEEQNQIVTDLLNNDVDAVLISPCNIYQSEDYLKLAKEKNIPIFALDERLPNVPYIGSDNYAIGKKAAMYMAEHLPDGAEVGVISGSANQDAHLQRVQGFVDYITEHSNLKISECLADETKYRQATIQTENLLAKHPQTRGIFVTSAIMTLATIEVTDNIEPHIYIVGVDTQNDAITAVKNKKIDAMISQDGHETGALAINIVTNYLTKQQNNTNLDTSYLTPNYIKNDVITIDNADNYLMQEDF